MIMTATEKLIVDKLDTISVKQDVQATEINNVKIEMVKLNSREEADKLLINGVKDELTSWQDNRATRCPALIEMGDKKEKHTRAWPIAFGVTAAFGTFTGLMIKIISMLGDISGYTP
jgi:hypothetical protein